jgi:hypothetical protein
VVGILPDVLMHWENRFPPCGLLHHVIECWRLDVGLSLHGLVLGFSLGVRLCCLG